MIEGKFTLVEAVNLSIVLKFGAFPSNVSLFEVKSLNRDLWLGKSEKKT